MPWLAFFLGFLLGFFLFAVLVMAREEVRAWRDDAGWPPE